MNFGSFCGLQVIENPALTKSHTVLNERKWAHRNMYKPNWRFKALVTQVPSDEVFRVGDKLYVHPAIAKRIRDGIPNSYSMGARFAENDIQGKPTPVDAAFFGNPMPIRNDRQFAVNLLKGMI